ncbi:unnamed protein product [Didymodactylos carnosus]|uniref:Uncharacterized protein n=1 Tax=Didymodactylos carnosus TaxID=1234261 RepID=A0A815ZYP1_9BILA|nr:unnamed protein product [Didymodactylos carnosus]CAF4463152.1 unnamed protein product [Didymodactylos carnosus]
MPESWQQPAYKTKNKILPEYRRQSITMPVQKTNYVSTEKQGRPKKSPEKAHIDTLRRRERCQRSRTILLEKSKELGCLNNNRLILFSETDDEEKTDNEHSDAYDSNHNKTHAMNNNKQQKKITKRKQNTNTRNNGVRIQTKTTTEVPMNSEHGVGKRDNMRGINQHHISSSETEQDYFTLSGTEQTNYELKSSIKDKRKIKAYLQGISLSSEQAQEKENIHKLSRDVQLKATELYLKIAKEEYEFQNEKLEKLLRGFPQHNNDETPSTRSRIDGSAENDEDDDEVFTQRPFTQRALIQTPLSQEKQDDRTMNRQGSDFFTALKRSLLETEREVLFFSRTQRPRKDTLRNTGSTGFKSSIRKDFVLQA